MKVNNPLIFPVFLFLIVPGSSLLQKAARQDRGVLNFKRLSMAKKQEDQLNKFDPQPSGQDAYFASVVWLFPPVAATTAFNFYGTASHGFHNIVDMFSRHTFETVDGGKLLADSITPAINGPVLTSVSVLFATLTAITISSLYTRQNLIRKSIVAEVEELRVLGLNAQSLPEPYRTRASVFLLEHINNEGLTSGRATIALIRENNLDKLLTLMNDISIEGSVNDNILGEFYSSISKVRNERTELITNIQATFPPLHYVTLSVLASAICFVFLVETDQPVLNFLGDFQIRTLFSLLILVFSLLAVVTYDLNTPFQGTYTSFRVSQDRMMALKAYVASSLQDDD